MPEELKNLIEKIQEEGVREAEKKAKTIEENAKVLADAVIEKARKEAENIISEARRKAERTEKSTGDLMKQAGRDLLLTLRGEINAMLGRIVISHIQKALTAEELKKTILTLIKDHVAAGGREITISLKKEDAEKLKGTLLAELGEEAKKGITLKPSDSITAGFTISYDKEKSYYDFTDKALAEYIASCVKPKLAEWLKEK